MLGRARGATRWELNQGQSQWGRDWPPRKAAERRPARHPCDLDLSCHLWKRLSEEAPGVPPLRHLLQIGPELVAGSGSTRRLGHCSGTFAEEPRGELRFWPPGGEVESSLARPLPHGMPTSSWPGSTLPAGPSHFPPGQALASPGFGCRADAVSLWVLARCGSAAKPHFCRTCNSLLGLLMLACD